MLEIITLDKLLEHSAGKYGDHPAFQIKDAGGYRRITFKQAAKSIFKLQDELARRKVGHGDRVALISENRPEWGIAYLAVTGLGAVIVPLDAMLPKEDILPLLEDSGAKVIILSQQFKEHIQGTRVENHYIYMEDIAQLSLPVTCLPAGTARYSFHVSPDDTASIVYTSGTTGVPKGVMLTHKNIVSNVVSTASLFDFGPGDNFLSVLPLHHTFETTAGFLGAFYTGCCITYAESLKSHSILANMQQTGVTVMCGVPLLYQLFYDGIMREVEEKKLGRVFAFLFLAARFFKHVIGVNLGRLLFAAVHKKFGGRLRFFVSGGAALDPELAADFDLMGFTILQGYGLSESAPVLSCCTLKKNKIGSVGRPVPGVEIKIAGSDPVGEILAFGPNIMKGYYKRKELSTRVVVNGWLRTGDVGYLDEEGFLFITGRSKDVIVTASGVNVYPDEVEFALNKIPAVKESCVTGARVKTGIRKGTEEVVALIVPDLEYFAKTGETADEVIQRALMDEVQAFNRRQADYKRVARFAVRREELPKTRLKKIKRFELRKELERI